MAIDSERGKRVAIVIPAGSVVKVASGPTSNEDRMVDVQWQERIVTMFVVDLKVRGTEAMAADQSAGHL